MRMARSVRTRELTTLGLAVACVHGICANGMQVRVALTRDCARGDVHMSIATFIHMTHRRETWSVRTGDVVYSFYAVPLALL
jgi:hypothetical protein